MENERGIYRLFLLAVAALTAICASVCSAQDYRAKVQGVVSDSTHAVVPGAQVTLTNADTGISSVKTTNSNGQYIFDLVEPVSYRVAVEMTGFNKFTQENILGQIRADMTVNPAL